MPRIREKRANVGDSEGDKVDPGGWPARVDLEAAEDQALKPVTSAGSYGHHPGWRGRGWRGARGDGRGRHRGCAHRAAVTVGVCPRAGSQLIAGSMVFPEAAGVTLARMPASCQSGQAATSLNAERRQSSLRQPLRKRGHLASREARGQPLHEAGPPQEVGHLCPTWRSRAFAAASTVCRFNRAGGHFIAYDVRVRQG
jgi:hypothetical protein